MIIKAGVIIWSECKIGDFTKLPTAASICGGANVERDCCIGARSVA